MNIIWKPIDGWKGYHFFSLDSFPSEAIKNRVTSKNLNKANQALLLLGELNWITRLVPDIDFFISTYIMKDATSSAQIEWTQATMSDAFEYKADPDNNSSDAEDILLYIDALNYGIKRIREDDFPISLRLIRELHKKLMTWARSSQHCNPWEFRDSQNWIWWANPKEAKFVPPAPHEMSENLTDLEKFIHNESFVHPIIDVWILHAQFETIHPFLDGNWRTWRLLITFYLLHYWYLKSPLLFLSSYFNQNREEYYARLRDYNNGDVESWIDFFIEAIIQTAEEWISLSEKVTNLRDADLYKISGLTKKTSEQAIGFLNKLYQNPIVSTTQAKKWLGSWEKEKSLPATINFLGNLMNIWILELHKKWEWNRPNLYIHKEYLSIFRDNHTAR